MKTPRRHNPPEKWVRSPEAFEGLVTTEQFARAQGILEQRRRKYDSDRMLDQLRAVYKQYGMFRSSLLRLHDDVPTAPTYAKHFGSWDHAFQNLYGDQRDRARQMVHEQICRHVPEVLAYSDFFVLDRKLALSIQPAVPVPSGYAAYWPIRPDSRHVIDITLGVLLSDPDELDILGYVALPRGLAGTDAWRVCSSSTRTELFGRCDLAFLKNLL